MVDVTEEAASGEEAQQSTAVVEVNETEPPPQTRIFDLITIHMTQRTSKILLVRFTANRNAVLLLMRVTSFASYSV